LDRSVRNPHISPNKLLLRSIPSRNPKTPFDTGALPSLLPAAIVIGGGAECAGLAINNAGISKALASPILPRLVIMLDRYFCRDGVLAGMALLAIVVVGMGMIFLGLRFKSLIKMRMRMIIVNKLMSVNIFLICDA